MQKTNLNDIQSSLWKSVNELSQKLIEQQLAAYPKAKKASIEEPLEKWIDFTLRYIEPKPRTLLFSDLIPTKIKKLPQELKIAFERLCHSLSLGQNVNHYQSKLLFLNGTSESHLKTDLLWADHGIHHLHLSTKAPDNGFFSARADYLVFLYIFNDVVLFIDINRHPKGEEFSTPVLLETIKRNWPDFIDQFKQPKLTGSSTRTQQETHELRSRGFWFPHYLNGNYYTPLNGGIMSNRSSAKAYQVMMYIRATTETLASLLTIPDTTYHNPTQNKATNNPSFKLVATNIGLKIFEETTQSTFHLPRYITDHQCITFDLFDSYLLPTWAKSFQSPPINLIAD